MQQKAPYKTRQHDTILRHLASLGEVHTTAAAIKQHLCAAGPPIGTATIYRHLEKLVQSGQVRKFTLEGIAGACYQYQPHHEACNGHLHLKCESCGRLVHLACDETGQFQQHVQSEHHFALDYAKTMLYGTCQSCLAAKAPL